MSDMRRFRGSGKNIMTRHLESGSGRFTCAGGLARLDMDTALYNNLFKEVSKREERRFQQVNVGCGADDSLHKMGQLNFTTTSKKARQGTHVQLTAVEQDDLTRVFAHTLCPLPSTFGHWAGKCPLNVRNAKKDKPKHQGRVKPSPQTHPCSVCHELEKVVHPEAQLQTQNMNMMGDDPEDQAEAAWSQENAWLGPEEWLYSAAQGA
ncbi:hypothetical protein Bbelb_282840 [Branchiostoma belcheri]|nr:hypothetical protein Bbelb_282840 [Branchiostoma belcheri]